MNHPFDTVVLSTNLNPKYCEFWPIVAQAWHKLFGVTVHLAVVGEACPLATFDYTHIHFFKPVDGVPIANQAKVARYYVASMLPDSLVVMTNDIDLLPLNQHHILGMMANRKEGALMTFGSEFYTDAEDGKCMAGYLTAESSVFRKLFNVGPHNGWAEFVQSFIGIRRFDSKENILNNIHHEHPDTFSDESLLRYLLFGDTVPLDERPLVHFPDRMLDRANWQLDPVKLKADYYVDCHLPRPLAANHARIEPLLQHLGL